MLKPKGFQASNGAGCVLGFAAEVMEVPAVPIVAARDCDPVVLQANSEPRRRTVYYATMYM